MDNLDIFYDELLTSRFDEPTRGRMWWGNYVEAVKYGTDINNYWAWMAPWKVVSDTDVVYRNREGQIHRLRGPAYINYNISSEEWWKNGKLHRDGGPAIICKQLLIWVKEGKLHNLSGPAVVDPGGPLQYWIDGIK